jgi:hypothetical protein
MKCLSPSQRGPGDAETPTTPPVIDGKNDGSSGLVQESSFGNEGGTSSPRNVQIEPAPSSLPSSPTRRDSKGKVVEGENRDLEIIVVKEPGESLGIGIAGGSPAVRGPQSGTPSIIGIKIITVRPHVISHPWRFKKVAPSDATASCSCAMSS